MAQASTIKGASLLDALSYGSQRDCVLVFPTLKHAIYWWPRIIKMFEDAHGKEWIVRTRTRIVSRRTKTAIHLWVPYEPDPTMPMDIPLHRGRLLQLNMEP